MLLPDFILKAIRPFYHGFLSYLANIWFGRPSDKLIVFGVTGTNGKSTMVNLLARILLESGAKVGYTSTVTININGTEQLNTAKMTMPSGWLLHKWMRQMVNTGCRYAILEVSSEGLSQHRHKAINFDVAVFTNLTPEHIESHGSFENYKQAKGLLFASLKKFPISNFKSQIYPEIRKTIVTNADDSNSEYFKSFSADRYISYGVKTPADFKANGFKNSLKGVELSIQNVDIHLQLKGRFDVYNALCSIAAASAVGVDLQTSKIALEKIPVVPGRVEVIQNQPFMVVVDYAYEPEEMRQLYETVNTWPHRRIIQVLGPTGGGRDKARISVLGRMAAENAELVVITTDDPYDEDPDKLAGGMRQAALAAGKSLGQNLFVVLDRRAAIMKAFSLASQGDLVLITGKGADQKMAVAGGKYVDWDDRKVAREELGFKAMQDKKNKTLELI